MLVIATLAALALPAQSDTTFAVGDAAALDVETPGGSIVVRTWERPEIRVQADHSSRTAIRIDRRGGRVRVDAEASRGPATIVDYVLTVPAALDLRLEGVYTRIDVEGARGSVEADTNHGDIRIVGGRGTVRAENIAGDILVEGAEGIVEVEAVSGSIRFVETSGTLLAEGVGGSIAFEGVRASAVEAGTVGGRITYDGTIETGGTYFFATHGGPIRVAVPAGAGAEVSVASVWGSVSTDLPGAPGAFPRGERTRFRVGDGSATVEVETFAGRVSLVRASGG